MTEKPCPHTTSPLGTRYQAFSGELGGSFRVLCDRASGGAIFFSDMLKMWIVTRYDDVRSVLKEPRLFSSKDSIKVSTLCVPRRSRS